MSASPFSTVSFGPFVLDRKLAEGGMAEVFLARQAGFGGFEKQVVVKRILPSLASHTDFVDMFLNEARLAARLSHGNVVQVMEAGEIEGQYYIAMEYIDGVDLKTFYDEAERTKRGMPPGIACRIIADLLSGLHYAHTLADEKGRPLGIVHRDVTPQNVLITRNGTVKIVDFGIAKATNAAAQQTRVGQVKGKVAYLSPEQAMGRNLDARSDVFACGILLWELVTGTRLFSRASDMATIIAVTDDRMPTVRSVRSELPESLDTVLSQALARPISDRYPSALAMQQELEQLIRSEGWAGDRRALEKYVQQRVTATPTTGFSKLQAPVVDYTEQESTDAPTGGFVKPLLPEPDFGERDEDAPTGGFKKRPEPETDYSEQATMMGLPSDLATTMDSPLDRPSERPTQRRVPGPPPASEMATMLGSPLERQAASDNVTDHAPPASEQATMLGSPLDRPSSEQATMLGSPFDRPSSEQATMLGSPLERVSNVSTVMRMPADTAQRISAVETRPLSREDVAQAAALAASRAPSSPGLAGASRPPSLSSPMQSPPSESHAAPASASSMARRIAVASTAAAIAILVAAVTLSWHSNEVPPTVSEIGMARVVIEVSEPALVELDGHKLRINKTGEISLGVGHQATLTATTLRGNGAEVTRSIALPPAREGERIPVRLGFP